MAAAVVLRHAEYDIYNAAEFERELAVLAAGQSVVDFRNVRFIDVTCLSVLVRTYKRLRIDDAASEIALTNLAAPVRRLFQLTKLQRIFRIQ